MDRDKVYHPFGDMEVRMSQEDRERISQWMLDSGLVWAVNKFFLHPVGVALTVEARRQPGEEGGTDPEDESTIGYMWLWPSSDGWEFSEDTEREGRRKFQEFINSGGMHGGVLDTRGGLSFAMATDAAVVRGAVNHLPEG